MQHIFQKWFALKTELPCTGLWQENLRQTNNIRSEPVSADGQGQHNIARIAMFNGPKRFSGFVFATYQ